MSAKHLKREYDFRHYDYVGRYNHNRPYVNRAGWGDGATASVSCGGL